ncbi:uncharacterized protein LOC124898498 [Capsicum annuum]|uniref:uncharacterized protein LOC124898498 n=1 Tax=Capsicum annuum TaxID=4072 RepID=UPI001FB155B4|nr:uncharacterized protein LOC124898498 [Capsicum annuum]
MDPRAFTIPCTIGSLDFKKALCDLGESINLMPLAVYKKLGLGDPTPTNMRLVIVDKSVKPPVVVLSNVLVKVASFIFPADVVILDCEQHKDISVFSIVDVYYEDEEEVLIEEKFVVETLVVVLINFDNEGIEEYKETDVP